MKSDATMFPRLSGFVLVTGVALGMSACSQGDDPGGGMDTTSGSESTSAASTSTATGASSATTSSAATTSTSTSSATSTSTATSTSNATSSTAATSTATSTSESTSATSGVTSSAEDSTTTSASSAANSSETDSSSQSSSGASSSDATTSGSDEDFEPLESHFTCINDWENGPGFRITNVLGRTAEALEVANSDSGGVYPVGTIIQHLPTEAMVKRHAGFSPETKDWEFYILEPVNGVNTFKDFGPDISTMGATCKSCHLKADDQWDFVCNTSKDNGGTACDVFDFPQQMRDMSAANAPPCSM